MIKKKNEKKNYNYSIIVPCYNSEKTIKQCLKSIVNLNQRERTEIIVCDNNSTDSSLKIINDFQVKLIKNEKINNAGSTRNLGAEHAKNNYLIFIDSDVCVPLNLIKLIEQDSNFYQSDCTTGIFSTTNVYKDFYSQYKTLYCNFKFRSKIATLNSAIMIIKKSVFNDVKGFSEVLKYAEDTDFSIRFKNKGYKLNFNKNISIDHLKKFNFITLLKNDFVKSAQLTEIFLGYFLKNKLTIKDRGEVTLYFNYIINIIIIFLIIMTLIFGLFFTYNKILYLLVFFILAYILNNFSFFIFYYKLRGIIFAIKSILFNIIDLCVVSLAVISGFLSNIKNRIWKST
jgi:glycosyltransferase involved in cell wall biosynthesis